VKVLVIDNGGQWTHREYRVLRDLGAESLIVPNTEPIAEHRPDGVVLSGGALSLEGSATLGRVAEWIDTLDVPVLGICVGHQFLARHYGGTVAKAPAPEFGRVELLVERRDHPLFDGFPARFHVWASHNDQVATPPPGWPLLARSESCAVQAMAHPSRPLWSVQFHPEVEHTEHGTEIFERFLALCHR
jgi:GMP synthase (glutamine-hydrolysing)